MTGPLGRRVPTDWRHVERFPFAAPAIVVHAERTLRMPTWAHAYYDQGHEGACVGFGSSQTMSILNRRRYDARWLWDQAKLVDEWPDTNPGDNNGTSVRAAMDVLRTQGHVRVVANRDIPVALVEGIAANRWAADVDEVRTAIASGVAVTLGVNWYSAFDHPVQWGPDLFIGRSTSLGAIRGGHCVCGMGASDRRQAIAITNSWGPSYPRKVWMPYEILARLIGESGEAAVVTDR